jgi:SUMO ligase MMS21 Smc5/6 complex component
MEWQGDNELDELTCPITLKTFQDPVFAEDGHTYERSAISEWIDRATQGTPWLTCRISMGHW